MAFISLMSQISTQSIECMTFQMQKETKSLKVYGQKRNEAFKGVW